MNVETEGFFKNDYSFHSAAVKIFNQLYDAHTQYRLPTGYLNGTFIRPLSLRYYGDNGWYTAQGPLGDLGDQLYLQLFGINLTQYQNKAISQIDYVEIGAYARRAADTYFTVYKDPVVRFNALVRQKGWAFIPLQHFTLDQFPVSTVYGDTILPNFVFYPTNISNTDQLVQLNACSKNCMNSTLPANPAAAGRSISMVPSNPHDEVHQVHRHIVESLQKSQPNQTKSQRQQKLPQLPRSADTLNLMLQASDQFGETQFLTMLDRGVLLPVLRMKTFLPRS